MKLQKQDKEKIKRKQLIRKSSRKQGERNRHKISEVEKFINYVLLFAYVYKK